MWILQQLTMAITACQRHLNVSRMQPAETGEERRGSEDASQHTFVGLRVFLLRKQLERCADQAAACWDLNHIS